MEFNTATIKQIDAPIGKLKIEYRMLILYCFIVISLEFMTLAIFSNNHLNTISFFIASLLFFELSRLLQLNCKNKNSWFNVTHLWLWVWFWTLFYIFSFYNTLIKFTPSFFSIFYIIIPIFWFLFNFVELLIRIKQGEKNG